MCAFNTGIGKSDPFAVFQLNGQKVYKSQTKKKTIAPEWNESFDVTIVGVISLIYHRILRHRFLF